MNEVFKESESPDQFVEMGDATPLQKVGEIPPYKGLFTTIGTGFIWASIAMGSGELIWWPYFTAKYGAAFIGLLLPACVLQYFINQEIARYTATTGEGIFQGFIRVNHLFSISMWIMMVVSFAWFGSYVTSGSTALFELVKFPYGWSAKNGTLFWSYLFITIFTILLLSVKKVYRFIEYFMKALVFICLAGIVITVFHPSVLKTAAGYFSSFFDPLFFFKNGFPENWEQKDSSKLLTAICFAGMGGFYNVMYSYWIRDKGVAMSQYMGDMVDKGREASRNLPVTGFVFSDSEENKKRYKKWLRYLSIDNAMAVGINAFVVMIMCWLAWAILLPQSIYPEGWKIGVVQSEFFRLSMGAMGRILFLIISAAFLCDSWLGIADASARMHADFFKSTFSFAKNMSYRSLYVFFVLSVAFISCITIPFATPGALLVLGGVFNFIAMPLYCPAIIYLNYYKIPKVFPSWTRPSIISLILISLVTLIYIVIAIWYLMEIF